MFNNRKMTVRHSLPMMRVMTARPPDFIIIIIILESIRPRLLGHCCASDNCDLVFLLEQCEEIGYLHG